MTTKHCTKCAEGQGRNCQCRKASTDGEWLALFRFLHVCCVIGIIALVALKGCKG